MIAATKEAQDRVKDMRRDIKRGNAYYAALTLFLGFISGNVIFSTLPLGLKISAGGVLMAWMLKSAIDLMLGLRHLSKLNRIEDGY